MLTEMLSGITINQNQVPGEEHHVAVGSTQYYQKFLLPANYRYGTYDSELRYPEVSGFQLLIKTSTPATAQIDWTFEHDVFGVGWVSLGSGSTVGCHTDGEQVWMDVLFSSPITIPSGIVENSFRIGFRAKNIEDVWYSEPNPVPNGKAYKEEESKSYSFNFRLLTLTADSGIDFLGNSYRSVVVQAPIENTSTLEGIKDHAWRSTPQPSKFAVVSNYFDVRTGGKPNVSDGFTNLIPNPSFEYDSLGGEPNAWTQLTAGATFSKYEVGNGWAAGSGKAMRITATVPNFGKAGIILSGPQIPVKSNTNYKLSVVTNLLELNGCRFRIFITYFSDAEVQLSGGGKEIITLGITENNITVKSPPSAAFARIECYFYNNGTGSTKSVDGWIDHVMLIQNEAATSYFDGDTPHCKWLGLPGRSASVQRFESKSAQNSVVVDGLMLDPQTPNMAFSVYYSTEGDADKDTSTREWENKLWTRVPTTFIATQRQEYVFPEPIVASFIKIEYSNLQAQSYTPGDFQFPVKYKKFPIWVTDFFLARMELPSFVANRVGITYDALELAYNYFLDDLNQRPENPVAPPDEASERVNRFFSQSDAANLVDSETLNKINLVMNTYTRAPAHQAQAHTLLGALAKEQTFSEQFYPVESDPTQLTRNLLNVSAINREKIVYQQSMPVMYFFLACRHAYKELEASFDHNRAYFAGVNQIAFLRHSYTTKDDTPLYIEAGGDSFNLETNDFVINGDGSWTTY